MANFDEWLGSEMQPVAVYFADADCVEYVAEDTTCVYRRIDRLLTLVYDETNEIPIGFKLKGFKSVLEDIKNEMKLDDESFVKLVSVFEAVITKIGHEIVGDPRRKGAYDAAAKLAKKCDVRLYDLPLAA